MSRVTTTELAGSPSAALQGLINGFMASQVVQVAANLGIADLLADGAKTAETLASEVEAHAPSLHRLLRALASLGVLEEIAPARFALTAMGAQLRTAIPGSLRNRALLFCGDRSWRSWGELLHSVRTGESQMQHLYGMGSFEYLAEHPQQAEIFNEAMAEGTRLVSRALVAACDFSRFHTLVDVGGGNGTLIAAILAAAPKLRGIVFDRPSGNAGAPRQLKGAGVAERCEVVAGDFFRAVPPGADAYILKSIIHDWDDERSTAILKNCRKAISAGGKLLLVERVMPVRVEASQSHRQMAMVDIHMLVLAGGRERTEAEYQALFAAAGFELARIVPLPETAGTSLVEAVPVGRHLD
jgi:precorrin-6B methylase 2